jgi:hypothetical protein
VEVVTIKLVQVVVKFVPHVNKIVLNVMLHTVQIVLMDSSYIQEIKLLKLFVLHVKLVVLHVLHQEMFVQHVVMDMYYNFKQIVQNN